MCVTVQKYFEIRVGNQPMRRLQPYKTRDSGNCISRDITICSYMSTYSHFETVLDNDAHAIPSIFHHTSTIFLKWLSSSIIEQLSMFHYPLINIPLIISVTAKLTLTNSKILTFLKKTKSAVYTYFTAKFDNQQFKVNINAMQKCNNLAKIPAGLRDY